jgi:hypothetical protein
MSAEELRPQRIIKTFEDVDIDMLARLTEIRMHDNMQELENFINEGQEQRELVELYLKGAAKVCKTAKESGFFDD